MADDQLFTRDFWVRTATQMVHAAAGAAFGVLGSEGINTLHSLPWQALVSAAVFGGLASLLASLSSQAPSVRDKTVPASFIPKSIAEQPIQYRPLHLFRKPPEGS